MDIELGKIVGVWGIKGWVKLHSFSRDRADIANYKNWWLKSKQADAPVCYEQISCRAQGQGIVAQLRGIDSPELAQALIGQTILIEQKELPELPNDQFYWQQILYAKGGKNIDLSRAECLLSHVHF